MTYRARTLADVPHLALDRIDAFAVVLDCVPREYLEQLRAHGKPIVMVSYEEPGFACPVVIADNHSGVEEAVEHLLQHGHRRIAFAGDLAQYDIQQRHDAYRRTLRANGVEPDAGLFFPALDSDVQGGRHAGRLMVAAGLPSTAVLAGNDHVAMGLMAALREAGHTVPTDQAIIGFDNTRNCSLVNPAMSSINQDFDGVAHKTVELLAHQLGGEAVEPGHYQVRTSFVARASCGCASTALPDDFGSQRNDPVGQFVETVTEVLSPPARASAAPAQSSGARVRELGEKVAQVFVAAVEREPSPAELIGVVQACHELYGLSPSPGAYSLSAAAANLAEALCQGTGTEEPCHSAVASRLDRCVEQVSAGFSRAGVLAQMEVYNQFHASVWNDYAISMHLLRSHEEDPRSLQWMARTAARTGMLALWRDGPASRELEVVGRYEVGSEEARWPNVVLHADQFPPAEVVARCDEGPEGGLVLVLPVRTPTEDWGFLALVVPIDATSTAQDSYLQWSTLLSEALGYEAVTTSLKQSEERYALAARAANDGLWDWDLTTGTIYYSSRWKRMLGYGELAIGTSPEEWLGRVHADDKPALAEALAAQERGEGGTFEDEHRVRAADGTYRWVLCRGVGVPGDGAPATRLVGSLTDVTERRSLEDQLVHQALYDGLTGLPNRALFLDRLSQSIAYARQAHGYDYAVLWLDLDGFKVVNDSLGHLAGDKLLVKAAERISSHLRKADTAARFGGDEFAVLLHHVTDFSTVENVVRRVQEDLSRPYDLDGQEVVVTASIGIATGATGYTKAEDVLRDADIAMYRAKSAGRAGHATFDSSMFAGAISRLETESSLRKAIEHGQLELYYQPIVNLADGTLKGMEALLRWQHPSRGLIAPAQFLPVAEESGLIVPMGRWVQTEACRQLCKWKAAGIITPSLRASVNLSNREFWAPELLGQVDHVLGATGASPEWLCFEITEGVIMHNLGRALGVLAELHARGIKIHIDDFGTGYSSLEALHRLPIDALKIDRSFVANLEEGRSAELVRTIVQLGNNLGVEVIAEGIETPAQQQALIALGCPQGQGYWFSVPTSALDLGRLLASTTALPGNTGTSDSTCALGHAGTGREGDRSSSPASP
jgi:diguanylate cyclase (GGDEF)-like protein/PAS domain S-box-containing protein